MKHHHPNRNNNPARAFVWFPLAGQRHAIEHQDADAPTGAPMQCLLRRHSPPRPRRRHGAAPLAHLRGVLGPDMPNRRTPPTPVMRHLAHT